MHDARDRAHRAALNVGDRACDGAGCGNAAEQWRDEVRYALRINSWIVAIVDQLVGDARAQ